MQGGFLKTFLRTGCRGVDNVLGEFGFVLHRCGQDPCWPHRHISVWTFNTWVMLLLLMLGLCPHIWLLNRCVRFKLGDHLGQHLELLYVELRGVRWRLELLRRGIVYELLSGVDWRHLCLSKMVWGLWGLLLRCLRGLLEWGLCVQLNIEGLLEWDVFTLMRIFVEVRWAFLIH